MIHSMVDWFLQTGVYLLGIALIPTVGLPQGEDPDVMRPTGQSVTGRQRPLVTGRRPRLPVAHPCGDSPNTCTDSGLMRAIAVSPGLSAASRIKAQGICSPPLHFVN